MNYANNTVLRDTWPDEGVAFLDAAEEAAQKGLFIKAADLCSKAAKVCPPTFQTMTALARRQAAYLFKAYAQRGAVDIAPAVPADAPALAKLMGDARLKEDSAIIPGYIEAALAENYFGKAMDRFFQGAYGPSAILLKASQNNKIVGLVMAGKAASYEICKSERDAWCEIHWLYIDPTLKRSGIGSHLMKDALSQMAQQGYRHLAINMLQNKPATQAFYESRGLRVADRIVEYNERNGRTFDVPCLLLKGPVSPSLSAKPPAPTTRTPDTLPKATL